MIERRTHAHTCEPRSGMTVKRTWSLSSRIHTSLPRDDSDAVSSGTLVNAAFQCSTECFLVLVKVLIFRIAALNLILWICRRMDDHLSTQPKREGFADFPELKDSSPRTRCFSDKAYYCCKTGTVSVGITNLRPVGLALPAAEFSAGPFASTSFLPYYLHHPATTHVIVIYTSRLINIYTPFIYPTIIILSHTNP